ncbi:Sugar kinase of the NBD/HSP70 family, may containing an N-terminal HTH domain [Streptoalloteichus tenebrarius]|uniref:Sugar kinase of the NBD/HSP70 family, may containing an N-terminal HTH domain n=2 Tax=Streptoalloteichus tenebrarius (strain ATCC 17920 / DSM 40477 / JCM 4838 / CBS 697.72 / NBRC 16177 / NCIMB 11028 / NRRL B-12390 / A12253. 1 / ISP 5477) TaxID=1933 RepID=A0ABT1HXN5_STRSD|nr:Sugar kinase of the NBD/HSP70 family, may containing an N-terminal HTH domain [Streptoalloteichus tenebrarius]
MAGNPARMREWNQRLVLDLLRSTGPATRPRIARDTGLSKPTVGQALLGLEEAGLVRTVGRRAEGPGRAAVLYEANPAAGHVLAVDIGRERLRVAVADLAGDVVSRVDERNRCRSASALVRMVRELAERAVAVAGLGAGQVVATVVGSPGVADRRNRAVQLAPNLPGWGRKGLLDELAAVLGPGLVVENDANLAAVGERERGAARGVDDFAYLAVGTGLGLGLVLGGELFRGAHGAAGEVGYLPFPDVASGQGASAPGERGQMEDAVAARSVLVLAERHGLTGVRSPRDVFALARQGDDRAGRVVREEAERLASVVASVVAVVDPELVVLGGGIGANADLLVEPMTESLRRMTPLAPRVVPGELAEDAVLVGAVATGLAAARDVVFERGLRTARTRLT